jgi:hypothetical protein
MRHLMTSLRRYAALFMATSALVACGGDSPTQTPQADTLAGTYTATTFRVTPTGQAMIDVLAQNGSLVLTIASDNSTSGSLLVPSTVPGGTALLASMLGTATRTGTTVRFQQTADTFVRDLTWTISGKTLQVSDLAAGSARFTVTLTKP